MAGEIGKRVLEDRARSKVGFVQLEGVAREMRESEETVGDKVVRDTLCRLVDNRRGARGTER